MGCRFLHISIKNVLLEKHGCADFLNVSCKEGSGVPARGRQGEAVPCGRRVAELQQGTGGSLGAVDHALHFQPFDEHG